MSGNLVRQFSENDQAVIRGTEFFKALFKGATRLPPFIIQFWEGSEWHYGEGSPLFTLELKRPQSLANMFWRPSQLSLGEAYIYGDFEVQGDLEACFELGKYLVHRNWRIFEKIMMGHKLLKASRRQFRQHHGAKSFKGRSHSKKRDAQAIQYHYDISNDFYRLWLDERMVYSCAYFHSKDDSLEEAQLRKLDYICRKLRLKPGETLLDIGCGWGGLITHAVGNYGVDAMGITLSHRQLELAQHRIQEMGLTDRCRVELCDYRDLNKDHLFDKLVSVGMFEHVGSEKLPVYFQKAFDLLRPGGVFLNHGITESIQRRQSGPSFIDKYVFPDGELLPISTSLCVAEEAGFEVRDVENLREHYAITLRHWGERLEQNYQKAIDLTSSVICRTWRLYMAGSAAAFASGDIGLCQALLAKPAGGIAGLPLTRRDWYKPYKHFSN